MAKGIDPNSVRNDVRVRERLFGWKTAQGSYFKGQRKQIIQIATVGAFGFCGPMQTESISGARYFISFIDDKSRR